MCEVLWPHTHVMVDVPCGYSLLFVNQYRVLDTLLFVMVGVPCGFVRLGAMIKSVVYATTGNLKFSHVGSMRPLTVICILLVVYDGSMWEPILSTQYSIVYVFLSVFVLISCILRVGRNSQKCH